MGLTTESIAIITSIRINSGSGMRMQALAKYMARLGHDIVLTGVGKPDGGNAGVKYIAIPDTRWIPLLSIVAFIENLLLLLHARPKDIIVSKPLPSSYFPALIYRALFKSRIILDVDDVEHDYWRERPWYARVLELTEKTAARNADIVTTHSQDLLRHLKETRGVPAAKIIDLPQGVDDELFAVNEKDSALVKQLGLAGKTVAVYAAHFNVGVKDFDVVLQMASRMAKEQADFCLLVIGDGEGLERYKQLSRELGIEYAVRFIGHVPHNDIARYFSICRVAVNYLGSSKANICRASIKLREYLLSGLWVVCNEVSEDTRHFGSAVLTFPTGDMEAFCARMKEAIFRSSEGARNTAGSAMAREQFSWSRITTAFAAKLKASGTVTCGERV